MHCIDPSGRVIDPGLALRCFGDSRDDCVDEVEVKDRVVSAEGKSLVVWDGGGDTVGVAIVSWLSLAVSKTTTEERECQRRNTHVGLLRSHCRSSLLMVIIDVGNGS